MISTSDILTELARDEGRIPEGRYKARVLEQELRSTTRLAHPYFAVKLVLLNSGRELFAMVGGITISNLPFMKFCMDRLPGQKVSIDLRYRTVDRDRELMDARIMEILDGKGCSLPDQG